MILASVISAPSVSWLLWLFWIAVTAAGGAALIFIGLLFEVLAEKEDGFPTIASFRKWKRLKRCGEILVLVGVGVEVFSGSIFAIRGEIELKNTSPENQPVSTISASVQIVVKGAKRVELSSYTNGLQVAATMSLCSDLIHWTNRTLYLTNGPMVLELTKPSDSPLWEPIQVIGFPVLQSDKFLTTAAGDMMYLGLSGEKTPAGNLKFRELPGFAGGQPDFHKYALQFHPAVSSGLDIPVGKKAKSINEIKAIFISLNFLPHDSEILGGVVRVDVNNFKRVFLIPPQTNAPLGIFQIVTTNILTTLE